MDAYTSGPWYVETNSSYGFWNITNHQSVPVAGRICDYANANLIAAAPDLLAALREMLHQFADHEQYDEDGYDTAAINKARAAIAKANGEQS